MTDDTRPLPEQPAPPPEPSGGSTPPKGGQSKMFGWLSIGLFLAVAIGAIALWQMDGDDGRQDDDGRQAAATTTTAVDNTSVPTTTPPTDTTTTPDTADTGAPERASFQLIADPDGSVTLRGYIPSSAVAERLLAGAADAYGDANVIDEMTIGSGSDPEWMRELARNLRYLNRVEGAVVDAAYTTEGAVVFAGQVASDRDRTRTLERLGAAMGDLTIDDQLEVTGSGRPRSEDDAARQELRAATNRIVDANVLFATASADISAEGAEFLDEIADILDEYPSVEIQIEGHTDSQGSEEANKTLSQARADSVLAYLVSAGIAEDRLEAVGYGERRPVADNDTDEGRAQNRRIEFTVTDR